MEDEIARSKDHRTFLSFKNRKAGRHRGFLNQTDIHPQYLGVTGIELPVMFAVWKIPIKERSQVKSIQKAAGTKWGTHIHPQDCNANSDPVPSRKASVWNENPDMRLPDIKIIKLL